MKIRVCTAGRVRERQVRHGMMAARARHGAGAGRRTARRARATHGPGAHAAGRRRHCATGCTLRRAHGAAGLPVRAGLPATQVGAARCWEIGTRRD